MNTVPSALFIDSDPNGVETLFRKLIKLFEIDLFHAENQDQLALHLKKDKLDIIFIDVSFINDESGLQLYKTLCESPSSIVIAVIPEENSSLKSKILDLNPFFYISKPYDEIEVQLGIRRAVERLNHTQKKTPEASPQKEFFGIIGKSPLMTKLFDLISRVAEDDFSTVLIRGESGTGKELVAKAIHACSNRKSKNFVPVNCAAIPDELLESELFGHTKGAFTGANQSKQGRIQYADGGTLFLDEIGDMKPTLQAKLLRVLQEKEFEPVGGLKPTPVDTRVLAATHCDLEQMVKEGTFREDLYYRLSVIPLSIPSLKERKEDIPLLIEAFTLVYTIDRGRESFQFSEKAMEVLLKYVWKGNVRELENLVQHMSILYSGQTIEVPDLPEKYLLEENLSGEDISHLLNTNNTSNEDFFGDEAIDENTDITNDSIDFKEVINEFETKLIINAMRASGGNKKEAAKLLNLKRTTLLEKIKKKKLDSENW